LTGNSQPKGVIAGFDHHKLTLAESFQGCNS